MYVRLYVAAVAHGLAFSHSFAAVGHELAFFELIRCSRPWAWFVQFIRRFPFSAAQVSGRARAPFTWGNAGVFEHLHGGTIWYVL